MDCSLPGSSVHGIFQARVLEWGAIAFSIFYINTHNIYNVCVYICKETCMQVKKQQLESVPNWERSTSRLYTVTQFNLYAEYIMQNAELEEV